MKCSLITTKLLFLFKKINQCFKCTIFNLILKFINCTTAKKKQIVLDYHISNMIVVISLWHLKHFLWTYMHLAWPYIKWMNYFHIIKINQIAILFSAWILSIVGEVLTMS